MWFTYFGKLWQSWTATTISQARHPTSVGSLAMAGKWASETLSTVDTTLESTNDTAEIDILGGHQGNVFPIFYVNSSNYLLTSLIIKYFNYF